MSELHNHADRVLSVVESSSAAALSRLAASWRRSLVRHGIDPATGQGPQRLTQRELNVLVESNDSFLRSATPRVDNLYALVGQSGCAVLLTDARGIVLQHRVNDGDAEVFSDWGLWSGGNWSEEAEGTNGIGTCLAERRRVTIHRDDHFIARNTGLSCMDAPIFGPNGQLLGALDVSSARSDQTEGFNQLISAMVEQTARQIETDFFRATFPKARIIVAGDDAREGSLLAVDQDDLVVGATRLARAALDLPTEGELRPIPAVDLLGRSEESPKGFEGAERAAVMRALSRADGNVSAAAKALGIGRATMYRRMKRLGISEKSH
ncbi:GAF domain-containing protein [Donghicola sp.]|jgi:transcriptional regulator of acetoin/glycerol metabolism|uniref:helix-turn-helix domain-containing protein n=1 Tax=Donghicola sp. TaxID=1929294 RepID=UPI0025F4789A|nr:GAF domain-containing protein [Donghicola sp.]MCT4577984.1 GAF domain-containing protein [Donghicola sp.]